MSSTARSEKALEAGAEPLCLDMVTEHGCSPSVGAPITNDYLGT